MSILDSLDLDNVPALEILPPDEYEMRIVSTEVKESDNKPGTFNVVVVLEAIKFPNSSHVFRYFSLPNPNDDARAALNKKRWLKEFLDAFSITKNDIGEESSKGAVGWCLLGTRTYEGREQNEVKKFIIPA